MIRIFIVSPYAGNIADNVRIARRLMEYALKRGYSPFAPHLLYPQCLNDRDITERDLGISAGLQWLGACQEVWQVDGEVTTGMRIELDKAKSMAMTIRKWHVGNTINEITPDGMKLF